MKLAFRKLTGMLIVSSLAWPLSAAGDESHRPPPPPHDSRHDDYPDMDADDHPYDWQPTHDHRRVGHLQYADCMIGPDAALSCFWEASMHPDFGAYEIWVGSIESEPTLAATVTERTPAYVGPNPLEGDHALGFAIRVLDERGQLLAHTFPAPLPEYDRRAPRGGPSRLHHLPLVPLRTR